MAWILFWFWQVRDSATGHLVGITREWFVYGAAHLIEHASVGKLAKLAARTYINRGSALDSDTKNDLFAGVFLRLDCYP
jgi:hypothetical protein